MTGLPVGRTVASLSNGSGPSVQSCRRSADAPVTLPVPVSDTRCVRSGAYATALASLVTGPASSKSRCESASGAQTFRCGAGSLCLGSARRRRISGDSRQEIRAWLTSILWLSTKSPTCAASTLSRFRRSPNPPAARRTILSYRTFKIRCLAMPSETVIGSPARPGRCLQRW